MSRLTFEDDMWYKIVLVYRGGDLVVGEVVQLLQRVSQT